MKPPLKVPKSPFSRDFPMIFPCSIHSPVVRWSPMISPRKPTLDVVNLSSLRSMAPSNSWNSCEDEHWGYVLVRYNSIKAIVDKIWIYCPLYSYLYIYIYIVDTMNLMTSIYIYVYIKWIYGGLRDDDGQELQQQLYIFYLNSYSK